MRSVLFILTAALLGAGLSACASNEPRERAYVELVREYTEKSGLLQEYEAYVEKDPSLKAETKAIRKRTAQKLREATAVEKKALGD